MRTVNEELHGKKKIELMERCFECYAEYGLNNVGIKGLSKFCGVSPANLYGYFNDLDDLIIQATEHCMSKVENEFMSLAPKGADDLERFISEVPYWTAERHGKKYRLMYQIYTNPKYREYGKKFFEGVNQRYSEYADSLVNILKIPSDVLRPMIFVFVRACVHYALYEDEFYLQEQLRFLKQSIALLYEKFKSQA
ncbi:MAG: TetR/AcrR family transcriptional regulator [Candidatus Borkfalkiaceae bacterium]|nr:TetR/AcrR family transcriptional regulator [Clostridia bacterium]MDY6223611.1 TetR/AcrR family transcriptional regulator [Christensenellaceae bacterium]